MMLDFDYDAERVREDIRRRARTVGTAAARASFARCPECERAFDLADDDDAAEWFYGHDCEG